MSRLLTGHHLMKAFYFFPLFLCSTSSVERGPGHCRGQRKQGLAEKGNEQQIGTVY